jgi:hypothetical protein
MTFRAAAATLIVATVLATATDGASAVAGPVIVATGAGIGGLVGYEVSH